MVTFATLLVFILLNCVVIVIDISLFHYSILEELGNLYYINPLFGRIALYFIMAGAFISAIMIDIKMRKNKSKKQTT